MEQCQEPLGASNGFCNSCGKGISRGAQFCPHCGATTQAAGAPPAAGQAPYSPSGTGPAPYSQSGIGPASRPYTRVPNYLVQAILVMIFCCVPFGIVAIVYAAQVNGKLARGDYDGAKSASASAKTWCWVSFGVGLGVSVVFLVAQPCAVALGA